MTVIRVLMYGPDATSGGVATHTKKLTEELSKLNIAVVLHTCSGSNIRKIYQRSVELLIKAVAKRNEYDVIHIQASGGLAGFIPAIFGAMSSKIVGKPLVVTFHYSQTDMFIHRFKQLFTYVLNATSVMILVSKSQRDVVLAALPEYSSKLIDIPNGFSRALFHPSDRELCRDKLGIPKDKKILFNVSNITPTKGHKYFICAIEELLNIRTDIVCYIAGDGPIKHDLVELIKSKNLVDYVKFIGWIPSDEIATWMNSCDLFVHPSLHESFGIVQVEAMACGKPVVATRNGGSESIITSDKYGILCEPANPQDLSNKIVAALDRDWDEHIISNYAALNFGWDLIAQKTVQIYEEVLVGVDHESLDTNCLC